MARRPGRHLGRPALDADGALLGPPQRPRGASDHAAARGRRLHRQLPAAGVGAGPDVGRTAVAMGRAGGVAGPARPDRRVLRSHARRQRRATRRHHRARAARRHDGQTGRRQRPLSFRCTWPPSCRCWARHG
ncbi:hypothetical protein G6F55_014020 [Rhizopus delemar]|nr:hypothetical protein G6F55_014020 [Rhizopus delemar]